MVPKMWHNMLFWLWPWYMTLTFNLWPWYLNSSKICLSQSCCPNFVKIEVTVPKLWHNMYFWLWPWYMTLTFNLWPWYLNSSKICLLQSCCPNFVEIGVAVPKCCWNWSYGSKVMAEYVFLTLTLIYDLDIWPWHLTYDLYIYTHPRYVYQRADVQIS